MTALPPSDQPKNHILRIAELPKSRTRTFDIVLTGDDLAEMAIELEVKEITKFRFQGSVAPAGNRDWILTAKLGVSAVQECVITLVPIKTRIDVDVRRQFSPNREAEVYDADSIIEMNSETDVEPIPDELDLVEVAVETLMLHLPEYPRADGVQLGTAVFAEGDIKPLTDEDVKPFAGLAALRDKLQK